MPAAADLVHAPLAHWAAARPEAVALDDGRQTLSFAQLHARVEQVARRLDDANAPATVWVETTGATLDALAEFLGIIASGRCAAVADAQWTPGTRSAVRAHLPDEPAPAGGAQPLSAFYIGFTSGSTGVPKGFRRHHRSWTQSFLACTQAFGPDAASRVLAPGSASHSLFLFGMMLGLWSGAGVVVQDHFSAARALDTLAQGQTPCVVAVPSQLVMMLEHAQRRQLPPIEGVRLVMISGARWMRERTPQLRALFPNARVVEFYGASETSFIAWMDASEAASPQAVGRPFAGVGIDIREADAQGVGLIYVRSPMLFTDYVGGQGDPTAALRDGQWLSVRDLGSIDAQGRLCLVGRQNRMLVTSGKNLFPEEVEAVLAAHPGVAAVSVQGMSDPVRGQQVVAVVQPADDAVPLDAASLVAWCRERLESFKLPRRWFVCCVWPLTPGGKTDHPALARALAREFARPDLGDGHSAGKDERSDEGGPCLLPLR